MSQIPKGRSSAHPIPRSMRELPLQSSQRKIGSSAMENKHTLVGSPCLTPRWIGFCYSQRPADAVVAA
eukprot:8221851-Pyramimonas_sp.AAC.1